MLHTYLFSLIYGIYLLIVSHKWREVIRPLLLVAQVTEVVVPVDAELIVEPHEAPVAEILEPSAAARPGVVGPFRYPSIDLNFFIVLLLFFSLFGSRRI